MYENLIKKFDKYKILVIGDIMIDSYMFGNVTRISPEAPVPIVKLTAMKKRLGGCGNVANNVYTLGGKGSECGDRH